MQHRIVNKIEHGYKIIHKNIILLLLYYIYQKQQYGIKHYKTQNTIKYNIIQQKQNTILKQTKTKTTICVELHKN